MDITIFIKEQLEKTLEFYQRLYEQRVNCENVDFKVNHDILLNAYYFLSLSTSRFHLFKDALEEYMKGTEETRFKAALVNDLRDIVISFKASNKAEFYIHYDYVEINRIGGSETDKLNDKAASLLDHCYQAVVERKLSSVEIFLNQLRDFVSCLRSLASLDTKPDFIVHDLYECLLIKLNYEILDGILNAEGLCNTGENYYQNPFESSVFDKAIALEIKEHSRISNYLKKWINGTATLKSWQKEKNIDVILHSMVRNISSEQSEKIKKHQKVLFNEALQLEKTKYCNRLDHIKTDQQKLELASVDLKLINDQIEGRINKAQLDLLNKDFGVTDWRHLHHQIEAILCKRPIQFYDFDIHSEDCVLKAKALLLYKKHLEDFLKAHEVREKENAAASKGVKLKSGSKIIVPLPSFKYKHLIDQSDHITDLYNALKTKYKLISQDTMRSDFRKAFSGEPVTIPIQWTGGPSSLYYFIKCLIDKEKVEVVNGQHWKLAYDCFVQENGERFDIKKLRTQKVPVTKKDIIEKLVDIL